MEKIKIIVGVALISLILSCCASNPIRQDIRIIPYEAQETVSKYKFSFNDILILKSFIAEKWNESKIAPYIADKPDLSIDDFCIYFQKVYTEQMIVQYGSTWRDDIWANLMDKIKLRYKLLKDYTNEK